ILTSAALIGLGVLAGLVMRTPPSEAPRPAIDAADSPPGESAFVAPAAKAVGHEDRNDVGGGRIAVAAVERPSFAGVPKGESPVAPSDTAADEPASASPDVAPDAPPPVAKVVWPKARRMPPEDAAWRRFMNLRRQRPDDEVLLAEGLERAIATEHWPDALWCADRLVELRPDDGRIRFARASLNLRRRAWIDAIDDLEVVVAAEPENARAWHNLAVARQALGQLSGARRAWDRAIALRPESSDALARRGEVFLDLHDWSSAVRDFEQSLAAEPDAVGVRLNLALALWRDGRGEEALGVVEDVLERQPRNIVALNRAARIAWDLRLSEPDGSMRYVERAAALASRSLEAAPNQPEVRRLLQECQAEIRRTRRP
ncbi:MAG: tetratricopeptide repeat protein, partial [Planctomycetota bacterium]